MFKKLILFIFGILLIGMISASLSDSLSSINNITKECPSDYVGCRLCFSYPIIMEGIDTSTTSCISVLENSENDTELIKEAVEWKFKKIYVQVFGEEMEIVYFNETIPPENITETEENITEEILEIIEPPLNETENQTIQNETEPINITLNETIEVPPENITEENQSIINIIIENVTEIIDNTTEIIENITPISLLLSYIVS